jgi:hypothetical protein
MPRRSRCALVPMSMSCVCASMPAARLGTKAMPVSPTVSWPSRSS